MQKNKTKNNNQKPKPETKTTTTTKTTRLPDFLDKASIIRLTISFLKLRQFSVNGHPPWAPDFTTLGSVNPYSNQSLSNFAEQYATSTTSRQSNSEAASPRGTPSEGANFMTGAGSKHSSSTPAAPLNAFQAPRLIGGCLEQPANSYSGHAQAMLEEPATTMIEKSILKTGGEFLSECRSCTRLAPMKRHAVN